MPILMQLTIIEYEIGLIRSSRSAKSIIIKINVSHKSISALCTVNKMKMNAHYEKKVQTVMVINSTKINKMNNHLS